MGIFEKYRIRIHHMKHMRREITELRQRLHWEKNRADRYEKAGLESVGLKARLSRWRRVAVVAVVACPGSFVAGGYVVGKLLGLG